MRGRYFDKILLHFCESQVGVKYTTLYPRDTCKVIASYLNCNHLIESISVLFLSKKIWNHSYCIFLKNQHKFRMFVFLNKRWFRIEIEIWCNDSSKKNICISPKSVISSCVRFQKQLIRKCHPIRFQRLSHSQSNCSLIVTWLSKM